MRINKLNNKVKRYLKGNFWGFVKSEVLINPYIGLAGALILLLLGAFVAANINYISTSEEQLWRFLISFTICLLFLFSGFIFFIPFWRFRKKYNFLDQEDEKLAEKIVRIHNRSKQSVTSFHGINAIQFFKLETHTDDNHVLFFFKKIFSHKSLYFDLSRFGSKKLEVPIKLFEWIANPIHPAPDYGAQINYLLYVWMEQMSQNGKSNFEDIIDNWEISFGDELPKLKTIQYHVLFEPAASISIEEFVRKSSPIEYVFDMKYNGKKDDHGNRQYNSLRFSINDENEGVFEGILLIISNNQRITKDEIVEVMKQILS